MALGEGGDHGAATLPLIADQAKHGGGGGIVRSGEPPSPLLYVGVRVRQPLEADQTYPASLTG